MSRKFTVACAVLFTLSNGLQSNHQWPDEKPHLRQLRMKVKSKSHSSSHSPPKHESSLSHSSSHNDHDAPRNPSSPDTPSAPSSKDPDGPNTSSKDPDAPKDPDGPTTDKDGPTTDKDGPTTDKDGPTTDKDGNGSTAGKTDGNGTTVNEPYTGNDPYMKELGVNKTQADAMAGHDAFKSPDGKVMVNQPVNGKDTFHEVLPDGTMVPIKGRLPKGTTGKAGKVRTNGKPTPKAKLKALTPKKVGAEMMSLAGKLTSISMLLIVPSFFHATGGVDDNHEASVASNWLAFLGVGDYKTTKNEVGIEVWDLEKGALGADPDFPKDICGNFIDMYQWDLLSSEHESSIVGSGYLGAPCLSPYIMEHTGDSKWMKDTFMGCPPNSKIQSYAEGYINAGTDGLYDILVDCHGNSVDTKVTTDEYCMPRQDGEEFCPEKSPVFMPGECWNVMNPIDYATLLPTCWAIERRPKLCDHTYNAFTIGDVSHLMDFIAKCYDPLSPEDTLMIFHNYIMPTSMVHYKDPQAYIEGSLFLPEEVEYITQDCLATYNMWSDFVDIPGCVDLKTYNALGGGADTGAAVINPWGSAGGSSNPWGGSTSGGGDPWSSSGGDEYDPWATGGDTSGGDEYDPWATGGDASGGDEYDPWATGGDTSGGDEYDPWATGGDTSGGDEYDPWAIGGDTSGGDEYDPWAVGESDPWSDDPWA